MFEADLAIEGYDYIGYFNSSDLRALTGTSPASDWEETSLKDQPAVIVSQTWTRGALESRKQNELIEEENH